MPRTAVRRRRRVDSKTPVIQNSFNAGEWSPRMDGRFDLDRYGYAVKTLLNFLPRPQGPATRRSGTRYVANTRDDAQAVLIPFVRDANTAYTIEATLGFFRFFRNEAVVLAPTQEFEDGDVDTGDDELDITDHKYLDEQGPFQLTSDGTLPAGLSLATDYYIVYVDADSFGLSLTAGGGKVNITGAAGGGTHTLTPNGIVPYELAHTYTIVELQEMAYAQTIDILFLVQQAHPVAELRRTADADWELVDSELIDGPYLDLNITDTELTWISGGTDTVVATSEEGINDGEGFRASDVGRHIWIRRGAGTIGWVIVTAINNSKSVNVDTKKVPSSLGTDDWRLGAFYIDNHPGAVTFFEQRLAFGGTPDYPEGFWASRTADFVTFSPVIQKDEPPATEGDVLSDTALGFTLAVSDDVQEIRWLKATRQLLCGTTGGIVPIQASSLREPVTPSNINAFLSSNQGVRRVLPLIVGGAAIYMGSDGKRLFKSIYQAAGDSFASEELSIRAENILAGVVDRMNYAKDPDSMIWVRKTDGTLAALTMIEAEDILGWSRTVLGGSFEDGDPVVESIAVIPTVDESHSQLWLSVKRTINGSTVRHIGFMEEYFTTLSGADIRDAFMVDAGLTYNSPVDVEGATAADPVVIAVPSGHGLLDGDRIEIEDVQGMTDINGYFVVDNPQATTIDLHDEDDNAVDGEAFEAYVRGGEIRVRVLEVTGADHLEGETVQVLADGAYRGEFTVSGGAITMEEPAAAIIHLGLGYLSDLITLSPDYEKIGGGVQGKLKREAQVVLRLDESAGGLCGEEGNQLDPIVRRTVDDLLGHPVPLVSGDVKLNIEMRWGRTANLHIRQDLPLPLTVVAIMADALQDQT